jgi:CheY-like chemotaxis protein
MVPPVPVEPRVPAHLQQPMDSPARTDARGADDALVALGAAAPAPAERGALETAPAALDAAVAAALAAVAEADGPVAIAEEYPKEDEDEAEAPLALAPSAPAGPEGPRVLLVDDEPHFTDLISEFLVDKGFSVRVAHSGERAIDMVAAFEPRVVLLDLMMPGMGGMEALKRIKAARPDTSVIMVTAIDDRDTARRALALGASDYVTKPLTLDFLESVLAVHVPGVLPVALTADGGSATAAPGPEASAATQSFFARR